VCRAVVLLVSPREVWVGCVVWAVVGGRRAVKRCTWARARAEERVPMRRVRGVVDWGGALVVGGGAAIGSVGMVEWEGWCTVIGNMRKSQRVMFVVGVTKSNAGDKTRDVIRGHPLLMHRHPQT